MNAPFEINEAQWQALGLGSSAQSVARESWETLGYFRLIPRRESPAQLKLGEGLVVPSDESHGDLVVVYKSLRGPSEIGQEPASAGLFFTINTDGELWMIDGSMEWSVDSLEVACQALVEIGRGLGIKL